jgi:hypothetical protein
MESDPLQQLRDVHLPPEPAMWPPAFGWWLLAVLTLIALVWLIRTAVAAYKKRAPIRSARAMLADMYDAYSAGHLPAIDFLHQANELLKRLLVRAFGRSEYARMSGQIWLAELDRVSASQDFTLGGGQVLGEARFSPEPDIDVEQLNKHLQHLLQTVRP